MPLIERWRASFMTATPEDAYSLLSIGKACRTRYQIDRFMETVSPNYQATRYFFDWLYKGGITGVINLVERDFRIEPADIVVGEFNGEFLPRDKDSGMAFLHDLGTLDEPWKQFEDCRRAIAENIGESIRKYSYLGAKTRSLLSRQNVALVYQSDDAEQRDLRGHIDHLLALLRTKFGRNYIFVNVVEEGAAPIFGDSIVTTYVQDSKSPKNGTPHSWQGWDESWSKALSSVFVYRRDL